MRDRLREVDLICLAVDWLEACKRRRPTALAELYAETAVFECACGGAGNGCILVGHRRILEYWQPKLALPPPRPFRLEQIWPEAAGIALVYRFMDQPPVRVSFQFDAAGKIERAHCRPELALPLATARGIDP